MRKGYFVTRWQLMGALAAMILCLGAVTLMAAPITVAGTAGTTSMPTQSAGVSPVSEPVLMLLVGFGLIGLAGYGRKMFFKK